VHSSVDVNQPAVYAFWHGKFFLPIMVMASRRTNKVAGLVSYSKDGAILTRWLVRLGIHVVRGSSSRKGASSVVKLIALSKAGYSSGIAADGPRGPIYCAKSGSAYIAQKTGLPILPVGAVYQHAKKFHSWDKFLLPIPFSKAIIYINEPIFVNTEENIEAVNRQLELSIHAADAKAALLLKEALIIDEHPKEIRW
jgi:lysophospholipid acyltransferase (LPLAT)-like uncharacterized protein